MNCTALFVLASTMLLGALRPQKPWRWTLLVAAFVPIVRLLVYLFFGQKPYRAQIYESFLGFLTGIAGAYGGSAARNGIAELWKLCCQLSASSVILSAAQDDKGY